MNLEETQKFEYNMTMEYKKPEYVPNVTINRINNKIFYDNHYNLFIFEIRQTIKSNS